MNGWRVETVVPRLWCVRARRGNGGEICTYVIGGRDLAVVDTGLAGYPTRVLAPTMESLGLRLSDVSYVLNTHGHPDHIGGNAEVKAASGAEVILHSADAPLASDASAHLCSPADVISAMRVLGRDADTAHREQFLRAQLRGAVGVDRHIEEGDHLDLGDGLTVWVVHTPGHTPGSTTFVVEPHGIAITGDAVGCWGPRRSALPVYADRVAYVHSLRRLAELGLDGIALGHPFVWSGEPNQPSAVRRGEAMRGSLADSAQLVATLDAAVAAALSSGTVSGVEDLAQRVLAALDRDLAVHASIDGVVPAGAVATVLAHLRTLPEAVA